MEKSTYDPVYDEEQQMDLMQFFRKYKKSIRQLLIITEGYCGLTNYDDLTNDQILRVVTYTKQRRVVAKENKVKQRRTSYLSIPVCVPYMFKVVRGYNKVDEPARLSDIIKKHKYPIMIQFANNHSKVQVGEATEDSSSFASLLLIKEYKENFLCFHCVDKGKIMERVNLSALSTNISCTLITGERNMTKKEFQKHLATMDRKIAHTKYDRTSGNPEITRITDEGTGTGNPIPDVDPSFLPEDYSVENSGPPPKVPTRYRPKISQISDDDGNYEPPPIPIDRIKGADRPPKVRQLPPTVPHLTFSNISIFQSMKKGYENTTIAVPPMPKIQESYCSVDTEPTMTEDEYVCDGGIYEEILEYDPNDNSKSNDPRVCGANSNESIAESPQREWLDNLSVSGVSSVLKKLRLHNYVDKFRKDMVSGSILGEYDEDILKEEYRFNRIEIIRLMKFVRTGHIPI